MPIRRFSIETVSRGAVLRSTGSGYAKWSQLIDETSDNTSVFDTYRGLVGDGFGNLYPLIATTLDDGTIVPVLQQTPATEFRYTYAIGRDGYRYPIRAAVLDDGSTVVPFTSNDEGVEIPLPVTFEELVSGSTTYRLRATALDDGTITPYAEPKKSAEQVAVGYDGLCYSITVNLLDDGTAALMLGEPYTTCGNAAEHVDTGQLYKAFAVTVDGVVLLALEQTVVSAPTVQAYALDEQLGLFYKLLATTLDDGTIVPILDQSASAF